MQATYRAKLAIWQAVHSPLVSQDHKETLCHSTAPLSSVVGQFHRLAMILLTTLVGAAVIVWLAMRVIYPQTESYIDDLSGYKALMPGEIAHPKDYSFCLLEHVSGLSDSELHSSETNTYLNSSHKTQVVMFDIDNQQKQVKRYVLSSNTVRLVDLLCRWGRPTYKQKDIGGRHWDFKWLGDKYTVSVDCRTLKLEAPVALVIITLN